MQGERGKHFSCWASGCRDSRVSGSAGPDHIGASRGHPGDGRGGQRGGGSADVTQGKIKTADFLVRPEIRFFQRNHASCVWSGSFGAQGTQGDAQDPKLQLRPVCAIAVPAALARLGQASERQRLIELAGKEPARPRPRESAVAQLCTWAPERSQPPARSPSLGKGAIPSGAAAGRLSGHVLARFAESTLAETTPTHRVSPAQPSSEGSAPSTWGHGEAEPLAAASVPSAS